MSLVEEGRNLATDLKAIWGYVYKDFLKVANLRS